MTASGWPYSTGDASSTRMRVTVPDLWAGIWFIVFIASMMRMVWPSLTRVPTAAKTGLPGSGERYAVPTMGEVRVPGLDDRSSTGPAALAADPAGAVGWAAGAGGGGGAAGTITCWTPVDA